MPINTRAPLGYIMDSLKIRTSSLAHILHVDVSLISKWKSGKRALTTRSVYFDEIIEEIVRQSQSNDHQLLKQTLLYFFPNESFSSEEVLIHRLRTFLSYESIPESAAPAFPSGTPISASFSFEGNEGKRAAVRHFLDYVESTPSPGTLLFIDSMEYNWLLDDTAFAKEFVTRIENLLHRGFKAQFVIHYSASRTRAIELFNACGLLIFNRNVIWHYYDFYDENMFGLSICQFNHALALTTLSVNNKSITFAYTDQAQVLPIANISQNIIEKCHHLFNNIPLTCLSPALKEFYHYRQRCAFYSYLPSPAFLLGKRELLAEILTANNVTGNMRELCLHLNQNYREATSPYLDESVPYPPPFFYIFQLEEMEERAHAVPFISRSLSLLTDQPIQITPHQYAEELRDLANTLMCQDNVQIILVSKKDKLPLPAINCWCREHSWMLQMDRDGFRQTDEMAMISAASTVFEQCIHKVPPARKEKLAVHRYLLSLADELDGKPLQLII